MARIKYYYDTESCKYTIAQTSKKSTILSVIGFLSLAISLSAVFLIIYNNYFDSPKEISLKSDIKNLEFYYSDLQKKVSTLDKLISNVIYRDDNIYRTVLGAKPLDKQIREGGVGGNDKYEDIKNGDFSNTEMIKILDESVNKLRRRVYIESKSQDEIIKLSENKEKLYAAIPAIPPLPIKASVVLSSGFGMRIHPILKVRAMHPGIDFSAPIGTPIYATADGTVAEAETSFLISGYGIKVEIEHGFGYRTRYAHMQAFVIKKGQHVKRGELIGYVGNTGLSTAPHLHYEVFVRGAKVNPIHYFFKGLTPSQYAELVKLASIENQSLGM